MCKGHGWDEAGKRLTTTVASALLATAACPAPSHFSKPWSPRHPRRAPGRAAPSQPAGTCPGPLRPQRAARFLGKPAGAFTRPLSLSSMRIETEVPRGYFNFPPSGDLTAGGATPRRWGRVRLWSTRRRSASPTTKGPLSLQRLPPYHVCFARAGASEHLPIFL